VTVETFCHNTFALFYIVSYCCIAAFLARQHFVNNFVLFRHFLCIYIYPAC